MVLEGRNHRCCGQVLRCREGDDGDGADRCTRNGRDRRPSPGGPPPVGCRVASLEGSGENPNEHQSYVPTRCRDNFCCGNRFQSCSCKRRPARPAGPAPAGHDEKLLSGRPIWFWQVGRVRWRQIFRRLVLAPMDDSLPYRPSVLLRLCGRRRTATGSATAWRLRR
jgi:hypothetical protein